MIVFDNNAEYEADFDLLQTAEDVVKKALESESCPFSCEISLTLTDNSEIKEINKEFRNIDSETDVLSFPACDFESPADFSFIDEEDLSLFNPDSDELILGDIMISAERMVSQAAEYGHSVRREFAFLVAHSMLHLMGYDHMNDDEAKVMFDKQEQILKSLNITRED